MYDTVETGPLLWPLPRSNTEEAATAVSVIVASRGLERPTRGSSQGNDGDGGDLSDEWSVMGIATGEGEEEEAIGISSTEVMLEVETVDLVVVVSGEL